MARIAKYAGNEENTEATIPVSFRILIGLIGFSRAILRSNALFG